MSPPFSLRSGGSMRACPLSTATLYRVGEANAHGEKERGTHPGRAFYNYADMTTDSRQAAKERVADLIRLLRADAAHADELKPLVDEAEALDRAIAAFHLEGIRFRIYNVDRLVSHGPVALPQEASSIVADVRRHLEAAGFHTRSHQAPG